MPRARSAAARATWLASFVAVVCFALPSGAQSLPSVALGETSPGPVAGGLFREALSDALEQLPGVRVAPGREASFVVRGAVTKLERAAVAEGERVECEVSLVVADRRGGAVRFISNGRARSLGDRADELTDAVVRAAVRSAVRPLVTQLRAR